MVKQRGSVFQKSSKDGIETTSNTNINTSRQDGYKGMDGKTYKSFREYRKNSEKRLLEMARLSDQIKDIATTN